MVTSFNGEDVDLIQLELNITAKSLVILKEIIDEFYVKKGILLDESHDVNHARAVVKNAIDIFHAIKYTVFKDVDSGGLDIINAMNKTKYRYAMSIIIAATFHDAYDHKYITDESVIKAIKNKITDFIKTVSDNPKEDAAIVFDTIDNMSWSKGVYRLSHNITHTPLNALVFDVVQDADRVEAIGPIGVRRNYLYTKHKICTSAEDIKVIRRFMIEHMKEKLILIYPALNCEVSKTMFESRHDYTLATLKKLQKEEKRNIVKKETWAQITGPIKT